VKNKKSRKPNGSAINILALSPLSINEGTIRNKYINKNIKKKKNPKHLRARIQ
jgi:hypothetical protein